MNPENNNNGMNNNNGNMNNNVPPYNNQRQHSNEFEPVGTLRNGLVCIKVAVIIDLVLSIGLMLLVVIGGILGLGVSAATGDTEGAIISTTWLVILGFGAGVELIISILLTVFINKTLKHPSSGGRLLAIAILAIIFGGILGIIGGILVLVGKSEASDNRQNNY